MSEHVYILNTFRRPLTYHRYGRIKDECDVTACGRVLWDGKIRYNALLAHGDAATIGWPCCVCYPPDRIDEGVAA